MFTILNSGNLYIFYTSIFDNSGFNDRFVKVSDFTYLNLKKTKINFEVCHIKI